ncbi:44064_t:CDS:1, partial [Gigaspora margarita]
HAKEKELIKVQEASIQDLNKDNIVGFMNPHKVTGKGRPKETSYYSESKLQKQAKKKHKYTCGFCKKS